MLVDLWRSTARRRRVPALVPQAHGGAARRARRARLEVAFENEFALATSDDGGYAPVDSSLCFSTIGMTASQAYVDALVDALERQRIALEQYYAELGHGQQEISTTHAPALRAADEQLLVRETIRGVAAQHGLVASLAPKPWPGAPATAVTSTSRSGITTATASTTRRRPDLLSREARSFLAGVLEHLPALCGLTAPSFNSYQRIVPQYWAGAFTCWGHDNREAPIRVPSVFSGMEEASTNAELKAADSSANPYLAVGGLIAAGLDGIERSLELPDAVEVDPATIPEEERTQRGIRRLPATQAEALDALAGDTVLLGCARAGARRVVPRGAPLASGTPTSRATRRSSSTVTSSSTDICIVQVYGGRLLTGRRPLTPLARARHDPRQPAPARVAERRSGRTADADEPACAPPARRERRSPHRRSRGADGRRRDDRNAARRQARGDGRRDTRARMRRTGARRSSVLTSEGESLAAEAAQRHREFVGEVLATLDPDERAELVRLTEKATVALRARSEELAAR